MREKVLIVDDIELNREILAVALGDEYEVLQASDGVQTIEILKTDSEGITAMLLDLIMPNVDGYAVLDYMREHGLLERIPVIVISAESARDVEVKQPYHRYSQDPRWNSSDPLQTVNISRQVSLPSAEAI